MNTPTFTFLRCLGPLSCAALWLALAMPACSAAPAPQGIDEVSLERDCQGCGGLTRMVVRSDGSATYTQVGQARFGTADRVQQGRVTALEFKVLADLLVQRGFFAMADRFEDPALQDGSWRLVRVTRHGQVKEVFAREDAAPPDLKAVEIAIDTLRAKLTQAR